VQYGSRITAIIVYLYTAQFLSKKCTAQALSELFGTPVSEGTVAAATRRAAGGLTGFLELMRGKIAQAPVAHFDETGFRVEGTLHWVHSDSTGTYSLITVHPQAWGEGDGPRRCPARVRRCRGARRLGSVRTPTPGRHPRCAIATCFGSCRPSPTSPPNGEQWCWATQVTDALCELKGLTDAAIEANLPRIDDGLAAIQVGLLRSAVILGVHRNRARSTKIMATHHVHFSNNAAEREFRMVKLRQKCPDAPEPLPVPDSSPRSGRISPPQPNMGSPSFAP
jgi:transposase